MIERLQPLIKSSRDIINNPCGQIALCALVSSLAIGILSIAPLNALPLTCGIAAIVTAVREYREYAQLKRNPISVPDVKFNIRYFEAINWNEPWPKTLAFCNLAVTLCGGAFLATQVIAVPSIMLMFAGAGVLIRITEFYLRPRHKGTIIEQVIKHEWVSLGIASLACRILKDAKNPAGVAILSLVLGYFVTNLLIKQARYLNPARSKT